MRLLGLFVCLAGCATTAAGPVVTSVESVTQEAQICGDARALRAGDSIRFQRRTCKPLNAKSSVLRCGLEDVDRGEVIRVVDARCATVRVAAGVVVQPGDCISQASKSQ
jgi:hypothetical protein